ncbi:MAG: hypothetical protein LBI82_08900 [Dysgonamonadaceae bacterium]|jgi:hypothetical protein|nr:hypothetical protein [Dysgonamonadaceae bacterium]
MKKTVITFLSILALIVSGCGRKMQQSEPTENIDKYVGIYEYIYPYSSDENHYIVLMEDDGKLIGLYYGNSDEFEEVREGYLPGFFVVPMDELEINKDTMRFVLNVVQSDLLTNPISLRITSTQEAFDKGNKSWWNNISPEPKKYVGLISADEGTIFFKEESNWAGDRIFVKKPLESTQPRGIEKILSEDEIIVRTYYGDLNKDNEDDCVIITQKSENNYQLGMTIALKKNENYKVAWTMSGCFEPQKDYEDNGSGFRTGDAFIFLDNGKLIVHYKDAKDSSIWWEYVFRLRNNELELIGFEDYNTNLPHYESRSINFLTSKILLRNEETFNGKKKESWYTLKISIPLNLTDLLNEFHPYSQNFEGLNAMMFCQDSWMGRLEIILPDNFEKNDTF